MHQTVATVLEKLLLALPPQSQSQAISLDALAAVMWAMHSTVSSMFQAMPGGLVFFRDMFLNIPLIVDWKIII